MWRRRPVPTPCKGLRECPIWTWQRGSVRRWRWRRVRDTSRSYPPARRGTRPRPASRSAAPRTPGLTTDDGAICKMPMTARIRRASRSATLHERTHRTPFRAAQALGESVESVCTHSFIAGKSGSTPHPVERRPSSLSRSPHASPRCLSSVFAHGHTPVRQSLCGRCWKESPSSSQQETERKSGTIARDMAEPGVYILSNNLYKICI